MATSVMVTGGRGFLGRAVIGELEHQGLEQVLAVGRAEADLIDAGATVELLERVRPDTVVHLAAEVGGIGANREQPGRFAYANLAMGVNLIEGARLAGVRRVVLAGTVCAYPRDAPVPFREQELWDGYPEETNAAYGVAKRALMVMLDAYREQYGMRGLSLLPVNLYGPGDSFDVAHGHVIPALIERFEAARREGSPSVTCWGTGRATREFLFVEDAARAVAAAVRSDLDGGAVNLGSGREVSMLELAGLIAQATGYGGEVLWDPSRPDGQPRRLVDGSRARRELGFEARVGLEEGLRRTVEWFRAQVYAAQT